MLPDKDKIKLMTKCLRLTRCTHNAHVFRQSPEQTALRHSRTHGGGIDCQHLAEDRAKRHIPMTMEDWAKRLDLFLMADDREILQDNGKITAAIAKDFAETEFEKFRIKQDALYQSDFDREIRMLGNKNE